ncbi:1-pyrroline-5-carboxylate dehydrogenase 1 [mine drainage metagenome]|uniref:L-glutamate gamma-semialdehyde dehydrogenase n=1 Tax=mine drainage metagenome TaxID=410659 RepID=A0A1J5QG79_9ZZZZ
MNGNTQVPTPINEPVRLYLPGSPESVALANEYHAMRTKKREIPLVINGKERKGHGKSFNVVEPHNHKHVLAVCQGASETDVVDAIAAAKAAAPAWRNLPFDERAAVFLKAADLLSGPWRNKMLAATMLGQSKTCYQAEIDGACELIDFWRFNVSFAHQILSDQPISSPGIWNRSEYRSLEGFVYAITPFNFTAIGGNLPTAPALMGNTVIWKPAHTQMLAASITMELLQAAGLPDGVINLVPGDASVISDVVLAEPDLAGIHFTGSTAVFQKIWATVGTNIHNYRTYPRLVGETGGKDFIFAHPSADVEVLQTAMIRGAYEYQGQKCSAASRAYVPASIWAKMKDGLVAAINELTVGDVSDFSNFMGAVIDERAFKRLEGVLQMAIQDPKIEILAGGTCDDSIGYFVKPTLITCTDPTHEVFATEYFGPFLAVYVYEDSEYDNILAQMESIASYALTGAFIATDRNAIDHATKFLQFAAGNFYINDKPTGAVVGQQPFGGARGSGTNDKAGSAQNLLRWVSARSVKETLVPATNHLHPHQGL